MRTVAFVLAMCCASSAFAELWTVQTVALRDYRIAEEWVEDLSSEGLVAYHEFAMDNGKQYVRVRFGCFLDRSAAELIAAGAVQHIDLVGEAAPVPLSEDAPVDVCVDHDVGFNLTDAWGVLAENQAAIVFWVDVGGRRGYVAFDGERWQVLQTLEEAEALLSRTHWFAGALAAFRGTPPQVMATDALPASFETREHDDFVQATSDDGRLLLVGRGELLWHNAHAAVVVTQSEVLAVTIVNGK